MNCKNHKSRLKVLKAIEASLPMEKHPDFPLIKKLFDQTFKGRARKQALPSFKFYKKVMYSPIPLSPDEYMEWNEYHLKHNSNSKAYKKLKKNMGIKIPFVIKN